VLVIQWSLVVLSNILCKRTKGLRKLNNNLVQMKVRGHFIQNKFAENAYLAKHFIIKRVDVKYQKSQSGNINGGDVQRKNVVNNVDKSSLWAP